MIPSELLQILADPNDPERAPLVQVGNQLVNAQLRHAYPIVDGVPKLRPEDAVPFEDTPSYE